MSSTPLPDDRTAADARLLVIDTATAHCSVALFAGGELLAQDSRMLGRGHAEQLVPMIAALPGQGRAARVLVNCGPGSFTGVRVGLAAARALALAWGVPVHGYSTLDLIAAMARQAHGGEAVDVAMIAGHGEAFFRSFDAQGAPLGETASLRPDAAAARSTAPVLAGSMAATVNGLRAVPAILADGLMPDAAAALLLPADARHLAAEPIYGRAPDAKPRAA